MVAGFCAADRRPQRGITGISSITILSTRIVLTLAANGAMLATGSALYRRADTWVNSFLKNEKDPKSFATFVITQMQAESGGANGRLQFALREVPRTNLLQRNLIATPGPDATEANSPFISVAVLPGLFAEYRQRQGATRLLKVRPCKPRIFPWPPGAGTNTRIRAQWR